MALPQPVFEKNPITNEYRLTESAKKVLRDILQAQELARFHNLVGYTPNPEGPWPRPWPWPWPWNLRNPANAQAAGILGNVGYPAPDDDSPWGPLGPLVHELTSNILVEHISKASGKKGSLNIMDAIKREGIAKNAYNELNEQIGQFQKELAVKEKMLA